MRKTLRVPLYIPQSFSGKGASKTGSPTSGRDSSDLLTASENLQLMATRKSRSLSSVGSINQLTTRHRVSQFSTTCKSILENYRP